jgi:hypothetical protein
MKIARFIDFIKEEFSDTPESYIETALRQLKKKIESMFDAEQEKPEPEDRGSIAKAKANSKGKKAKMSFSDLGVNLESAEISKYSKVNDSLTIKFTDPEATYSLIIMIEIKEGISKDPAKDFSFEDVENCFLKFKKYDLDTFEVIGQVTKNAKIADIDEDFLVDLKIELDDKFSGEGETLEIETEEKKKPEEGEEK